MRRENFILYMTMILIVGVLCSCFGSSQRLLSEPTRGSTPLICYIHIHSDGSHQALSRMLIPTHPSQIQYLAAMQCRSITEPALLIPVDKPYIVMGRSLSSGLPKGGPHITSWLGRCLLPRWLSNRVKCFMSVECSKGISDAWLQHLCLGYKQIVIE